MGRKGEGKRRTRNTHNKTGQHRGIKGRNDEGQTIGKEKRARRRYRSVMSLVVGAVFMQAARLQDETLPRLLHDWGLQRRDDCLGEQGKHGKVLK